MLVLKVKSFGRCASLLFKFLSSFDQVISDQESANRLMQFRRIHPPTRSDAAARGVFGHLNQPTLIYFV